MAMFATGCGSDSTTSDSDSGGSAAESSDAGASDSSGDADDSGDAMEDSGDFRAEYSLPDYYPDDYGDLIAESMNESGSLSIFSNTSEENWAPILAGFQAKYPWVTSITAPDLDSDEIFARYLSEEATAGSDADMFVTNAAQIWAEFTMEDGRVNTYESVELSSVPEAASLLPGVNALSLDAMTLVVNAELLDAEITGYADLADAVADGSLENRVTTRGVTGAFGFTVTNALMSARGDLWPTMETILPNVRAEDSSGTQLEKILAGEYVAGFIISSGPGYPAADRSDGILEIVFPTEGTVVLPRGIAIAETAPNPATARLFMDYVLSQEGQSAVADGGLTSYRDDATAPDPSRTYNGLVSNIGEENIVVVPYVFVEEADANAFIERWNGLIG